MNTSNELLGVRTGKPESMKSRPVKKIVSLGTRRFSIAGVYYVDVQHPGISRRWTRNGLHTTIRTAGLCGRGTNGVTEEH